MCIYIYIYTHNIYIYIYIYIIGGSIRRKLLHQGLVRPLRAAVRGYLSLLNIITLHYITLHYITLHYSVMKYYNITLCYSVIKYTYTVYNVILQYNYYIG